RSQQLDPLELPNTMPLRERCIMLSQLQVWQDAFQRMSTEVVSILSENTDLLKHWCEFARQPEHSAVD
ncbi:MAG: hypothetical protein ACK5HY_00810, partial [Parahaliea sp.]